MTNIEIVRRIIGEVSPVGETNEDAIRMLNLNNLIELTHEIMSVLHNTSTFRHSQEYSVKALGIKAHKAIIDIKDML